MMRATTHGFPEILDVLEGLPGHYDVERGGFQLAPLVQVVQYHVDVLARRHVHAGVLPCLVVEHGAIAAVDVHATDIRDGDG
jgi:hypothetical protein